jgi:hypothetical protein
VEDSQCEAISHVSIFEAKGCACPKHSHYLGRRPIGTVRADSDTSVSTMIKTIFGFTGYRVNYSKA